MDSFKLMNIKSFSKTSEVELKKINIFVGRNSSGKSSLIRFPVVLSQTFQEDIVTPILLFGKLIDYGNFDDVIYNHEGDSFGFGFSFSVQEIVTMNTMRRSIMFFEGINNPIKAIRKNFKSVDIEVKVKTINKKIIVDSFDLRIDKINVATIDRDPKKNKYEIKIYYVLNHENATLIKLETPESININIAFNKFIPDLNLYSDSIVEIYKRSLETIKREDQQLHDIVHTLLSNRDIPSTVRLEKDYPNITISKKLGNLINHMNELTSTLFFFNAVLYSLNHNLSSFSSQVTYIGPFRQDPERIYRDSENSFDDVGKNGENTSLLLRQADQQKNQLLKKVSQWFEASMGYSINIDEIENSNLFKVVVSSIEGKNKDNIIDVGYGIAQVLPIVTQVFLDYSANDEFRRKAFRLSRKSVVIIEQPELHLHPAAQANLANLFVEKVLSDSNSRMLIETHSEHLIRRLQVLIADPDIDIGPDDVAFYYIDKNKEDNSSYVKKMELNSKGQFTQEWPSGFFDKGYELSKELMIMSKKRRSQ
ncbi:DUF3696 domain-containing protein [Paenibacillus glycanilyticus]|uniref:DUF3696 domain-containing protein n=1 Tax=Paenibacillus glycanilyticus TaxID=126569 RepID=UPI003EB785F2